jgi:hypothetical protein
MASAADALARAAGGQTAEEARAANQAHGGGVGDTADGELAGEDGGGKPAGTDGSAAAPGSKKQGGTWADSTLDLPGDAETTEERVAALERELHVSLATYDVAIGAEQRRATAGGGGAIADADQGEEGDEPAGASAGGQGASNAGTQGGGRTQGNRQPGSSDTGSQRSGTGGAAGPRASMPSTNTQVIPEDIPDGQDDDVVARQIREAAMNEPDAVLREKLWQEYRDYKASISGGAAPAAAPAEAAPQPASTAEKSDKE